MEQETIKDARVKSQKYKRKQIHKAQHTETTGKE